MFDENFSFVSSTADPVAANASHCTSVDISPFTSRCSSPHRRESVSINTSHPTSYRDSRYDTYRNPRHQSITALTAQLESHVLSDGRGPDSPTPSDVTSTSEQDEGFYDGPETPATSVSDYSPDFDPTLWDLSMSDLSATSSPRPSLSLEAQAFSSYTFRRRQRQALVRLQCLATRAPDLAMLIEECHPSSLPLSPECVWAGGKARSDSTTSVTGFGNGRIEKERSSTSGAVRRMPRMRKRVTR